MLVMLVTGNMLPKVELSVMFVTGNMLPEVVFCVCDVDNLEDAAKGRTLCV